MKGGASPIERLIDSADMRCTVCNERRSVGCDCWRMCHCGWFVRNLPERSCRNPLHDPTSAEEVS